MPPNEPEPSPPEPSPPEAETEADKAPRWFLESIAYLSGQITTVDTVARQAVASLAEQGRAIHQLQIEVFGASHAPPPFLSHAPPATSTPPPPNSPLALYLGRQPLAKRVTLSEGTTEALTRELANLRAEFRAELSQQSRAMGLPKLESGEDAPPPSRAKRTRAYLFSRAGVKDAIALMTLVAAALASVAAMRAAHGAPPDAIVAEPPKTR